MANEKRKGIRPQSAKSKGRKWQQAVSAHLLEKLNLEEGDIESRPMGSGGVDLMMSPRARKAFPISVECKKTTAPFSRRAIGQAQHNAVKDTIGAVVWQPRGEGGSKGIISFDYEEFVDWFIDIYQHQRRINETCGRCLGYGTIGVMEDDEYGGSLVQKTCPECNGTRKNI